MLFCRKSPWAFLGGACHWMECVPWSTMQHRPGKRLTPKEWRKPKEGKTEAQTTMWVICKQALSGLKESSTMSRDSQVSCEKEGSPAAKVNTSCQGCVCSGCFSSQPGTQMVCEVGTPSWFSQVIWKAGGNEEENWESGSVLLSSFTIFPEVILTALELYLRVQLES